MITKQEWLAIPLEARLVEHATHTEDELLRDDLLQAGFTPDEALVLDRIAWLESRCTANAVGDSGQSLGLLQIHAPSWCTPNVYNPVGYLQAALVLNSCEELFDPVVAVNAARAIYLYGGFEQWSTYEETAS